MNLEDLFNDFSVNVINHTEFVILLLLASLLSFLLSLFYKRYGGAIGNRGKFADNFMLLSLTTMLIIYIVKSSIALSLGLVGALSIVRFRAAIKDPEELVYLFLAIAIGLGMGAGQPGITVLAFVLIMAILFIKVRSKKEKRTFSSGWMHLNITADNLKEEEIRKNIRANTEKCIIKRISYQDKKLHLTYQLEMRNDDDITAVSQSLDQMKGNLSYSFIDSSHLAQ